MPLRRKSANDLRTAAGLQQGWAGRLKGVTVLLDSTIDCRRLDVGVDDRTQDWQRLLWDARTLTAHMRPRVRRMFDAHVVSQQDLSSSGLD